MPRFAVLERPAPLAKRMRAVFRPLREERCHG
jgi:hypothetical protein